MTKYIDIMDIKALVKSGRFAAKINFLGNVLLEDTQTCESIKLMQLPNMFSHHDKGKWEPAFIHTSCSINSPMQGSEGYVCSECGWSTFEKYDWCTCGADMRESKKPTSDLKKLLEEL